MAKSHYWLKIQGLDKFQRIRNQSNINLLILTEREFKMFNIDNIYKYIVDNYNK